MEKTVPIKTFHNQMINLVAHKERSVLHTVTFREDIVGFKFHTVGVNGAFVHGVMVDARNVWAMIFSAHVTPDKAVMKDGSEIWCGMLHLPDPLNRGWQFERKELRLGADPRCGIVSATCQRQEGWIYASRVHSQEAAF